MKNSLAGTKCRNILQTLSRELFQKPALTCPNITEQKNYLFKLKFPCDLSKVLKTLLDLVDLVTTNTTIQIIHIPLFRWGFFFGIKKKTRLN